MKSVITGSHGFLGQHLCKRLQEMGHTIIQLDRWEKPPKNLDYFFHLASYGNHSNQIDINEIKKANIDLLWFYLNETLEIPYKTFVNFSTSSVELQTKTMYSVTKKSGELLTRIFAQEYQKPVISVRPFSIYGPGEADFRFIPTVIRSIVKNETLQLDSSPVHDWVYVEDCIDAIIYCAEHYSYITQWSIPIGTGHQIANNKIVRIISELMGKMPKIEQWENMRPYDNYKWVADTRVFHWNIRSLLQGLRPTIEYYKKKYGHT